MQECGMLSMLCMLLALFDVCRPSHTAAGYRLTMLMLALALLPKGHLHPCKLAVTHVVLCCAAVLQCNVCCAVLCCAVLSCADLCCLVLPCAARCHIPSCRLL